MVSLRALNALLGMAAELGYGKLCICGDGAIGRVSQLNTDHTVLLVATIHDWPIKGCAEIHTTVKFRPRKAAARVEVRDNSVYIEGKYAGELVEKCEQIEVTVVGDFYRIRALTLRRAGSLAADTLRALAEAVEHLGFAYTVAGDPFVVFRVPELPRYDGWRACSPDMFVDTSLETGVFYTALTAVPGYKVRALARRASGSVRVAFISEGPILFDTYIYDEIPVIVMIAPSDPEESRLSKHAAEIVDGRLPCYALEAPYSCYTSGVHLSTLLKAAKETDVNTLYTLADRFYLISDSKDFAATLTELRCTLMEYPFIGGSVDLGPMLLSYTLPAAFIDARVWGYTREGNAPIFFDVGGKAGEGAVYAALTQAIYESYEGISTAEPADWRSICSAVRRAHRRGARSFTITEDGRLLVGEEELARLRPPPGVRIESPLGALLLACEALEPKRITVGRLPCVDYIVVVEGREGIVLAASTSTKRREEPPAEVLDVYNMVVGRVEYDLARIAEAYAVLAAGATPDLDFLESIEPLYRDAYERARTYRNTLCATRSCGCVEARAAAMLAETVLAGIDDVKAKARAAKPREERLRELRDELERLSREVEELRREIERLRERVTEYIGRGCLPLMEMDWILASAERRSRELEARAGEVASRLRELARQFEELGAEEDARRARELADTLETTLSHLRTDIATLRSTVERCKRELRELESEAEKELRKLEELTKKAREALETAGPEELETLASDLRVAAEELEAKVEKLRGYPEQLVGELIRRITRAAREAKLLAAELTRAAARRLERLAEDARREAEELARKAEELRRLFEEVRAERERLLEELSRMETPPERLEPRVKEFLDKASRLADEARRWLEEYNRYTRKLETIERERAELLRRIPAELRDMVARQKAVVEDILRSVESFAREVSSRWEEYRRRWKPPAPPAAAPPPPAAPARPPAAPAAPPARPASVEEARMWIEYYIRSRVPRVYRIDWRRGLRARISVHRESLEALIEAIRAIGGVVERTARARPPLVIVYADFTNATPPPPPITPALEDALLREKFYSILAAVGLDASRYEDVISRVLEETRGRPFGERQRRVVEEARRIVETYERLWSEFSSILMEAHVNPWEHREEFLKLFYETEGMPLEERARRIRLLAREIAPPPPPPAAAPPAPVEERLRRLEESVSAIAEMVKKMMEEMRRVESRVEVTVTPDIYMAGFEEVARSIRVVLSVDEKGRPACQPSGGAAQVISTTIPWEPVRALFYMNPETRHEVGYTDDLAMVVADILKYHDCGAGNPLTRGWLALLLKVFLAHLACESSIATLPWHRELSENPRDRRRCTHPLCEMVVKCGFEDEWRTYWAEHMTAARR